MYDVTLFVTVVRLLFVPAVNDNKLSCVCNNNFSGPPPRELLEKEKETEKEKAAPTLYFINDIYA